MVSTEEVVGRGGEFEVMFSLGFIQENFIKWRLWKWKLLGDEYYVANNLQLWQKGMYKVALAAKEVSKSSSCGPSSFKWGGHVHSIILLIQEGPLSNSI